MIFLGNRTLRERIKFKVFMSSKTDFCVLVKNVCDSNAAKKNNAVDLNKNQQCNSKDDN